MSTSGGDEGTNLLDEAWDLLDRGAAQEVIEALAGAPALDEYAERWTLEASARLALDDLAGVRRALKELEARAGGDSCEVAWAAGELALREWRFDAARAAFETYAASERDAAVLERLSLCAELAGDFPGADRLLAEAVAAAPDQLALPPRFGEESFAEAVHDAIEELPGDFQRALERTEVVVEPVPARDLFPPGETPEHPPDLLGLFVGLSELETEDDLAAEIPPRIYLFQRSLERAARDRDELVTEIRITLFHEFAHVLGFDEEGVEAMGLE